MQRLFRFIKYPAKFFLAASLLSTMGLGACLNQGRDELSISPTPPPVAPTATSPVDPTEEPAVVPSPTAVSAIQPDGVFISELLPGVVGDNNQEFIELYNAGDTAVSLENYTLSYLLGEGQDESVVYRWHTAFDIPPFGHFLLLREGASFDTMPDAFFDLSLFERKGGLILRDGEWANYRQAGVGG